VIPAEAVEALAAVLAQEALVSADMDGYGWDAENDDPAPFMPRARERARTYLEAAAPYMLAEAWDEGYTLGYADCANKQEPNRPNPYMLNNEGEK
jgi:hypothetical protein